MKLPDSYTITTELRPTFWFHLIYFIRVNAISKLSLLSWLYRGIFILSNLSFSPEEICRFTFANLKLEEPSEIACK